MTLDELRFLVLICPKCYMWYIAADAPSDNLCINCWVPILPKIHYEQILAQQWLQEKK